MIQQYLKLTKKCLLNSVIFVLMHRLHEIIWDGFRHKMLTEGKNIFLKIKIPIKLTLNPY